MVTRRFCCLEVAISGPVVQSAISDSMSLPGKKPAGMGASQLPVSKAKDLDKRPGWVFLVTEYSFVP